MEISQVKEAPSQIYVPLTSEFRPAGQFANTPYSGVYDVFHENVRNHFLNSNNWGAPCKIQELVALCE